MASADGNPTPAKEEVSSSPTRCANGCGFFGNPQSGGMCSKCYKETVSKQAAALAPVAAVADSKPVPTPVPVFSPPKAEVAKPAPATGSSSSMPTVGAVRPSEDALGEEAPPKKVQANTSRCWTCNRKVGLLGFQCKCEFYFCSEHRYSDRHECAFDYKEQGKKMLMSANPTIAPSKVDSI